MSSTYELQVNTHTIVLLNSISASHNSSMMMIANQHNNWYCRWVQPPNSRWGFPTNSIYHIHWQDACIFAWNVLGWCSSSKTSRFHARVIWLQVWSTGVLVPQGCSIRCEWCCYNCKSSLWRFMPARSLQGMRISLLHKSHHSTQSRKHKTKPQRIHDHRGTSERTPCEMQW